MESTEYPSLTFSCEFDDRTALEVEEKGFFDHAIVTLGDGTRFSLHFYDPSRLAYELSVELAHGGVCVAESGLVVIPKVTQAYMREAARHLVSSGYFSTLVPL